jgi:hypothetical protein
VGVAKGHLGGDVAEHGHERFEAHAAVDEAGGVGVAQLVGGERGRSRPGWQRGRGIAGSARRPSGARSPLRPGWELGQRVGGWRPGCEVGRDCDGNVEQADLGEIEHPPVAVLEVERVGGVVTVGRRLGVARAAGGAVGVGSGCAGRVGATFSCDRAGDGTGAGAATEVALARS